MAKKLTSVRISPYTQFYLDDLKNTTGMNTSEIISHAVLLLWVNNPINKDKIINRENENGK